MTPGFEYSGTGAGSSIHEHLRGTGGRCGQPGRGCASNLGAWLRGQRGPPRGGKGLTFPGAVSIVTVHSHRRDPGTAKGECLERHAPAKRKARTHAGTPVPQEKYLLFRVGEETYGLGLRGLQEVLLPDGMTFSPAPSHQVCAALPHRGRQIPVVRLSQLFELPAAGSSPMARVLLTKTQSRPLGLLVDEVLEMAEVNPTEVGNLPALATLLPPSCFLGVFTRQERIIVLVNENGLANLDEVSQFRVADS